MKGRQGISPPIIGVMGGSACTDEEYRLARDVGRCIAERGAILLCGGGSGVMEAAAKAAREAGGEVIGVMPGRGPDDTLPNAGVTLPIYTGLGDARNVVNALTCRAIIAIGGGWGTLSEIALARKNGRPVILLESWRIDHPNRPTDGVVVAAAPEEAVALALE